MFLPYLPPLKVRITWWFFSCVAPRSHGYRQPLSCKLCLTSSKLLQYSDKYKILFRNFESQEWTGTYDIDIRHDVRVTNTNSNKMTRINLNLFYFTSCVTFCLCFCVRDELLIIDYKLTVKMSRKQVISEYHKLCLALFETCMLCYFNDQY